MEKSDASNCLTDESTSDLALVDSAQEVPESLWGQLSEYINLHLGLHFPKERWRGLKRSMAAVARELAVSGQESNHILRCIRFLLAKPPTAMITNLLARHLTIGETYFFRDMYLFDVLKEHVLPDLIQKRRFTGKRLRFWSAGCCTGEEPYTLSIILDKLLADQPDWDLMISATDINTDFLQKARDGYYTSWSFRETPKWVLNDYFSRDAGLKGYQLNPSVKRIVRFMQYNLIEPDSSAISGELTEMDIIFCRNVLMYFKPEQRSAIINALAKSLINGGWFVISPSETGYVKHEMLKPINFSGVLLFRKSTPMSVTDAAFSEFRGMAGRKQANDHHRGADRVGDRIGDEELAKKSPHYAEALDHFQHQRYAEALQALQRLSVESGAEKTGERPEMHFLRGRALAALGETEQAIAFCERAAAVAPIQPDIHYQLAILYQEIGLFDESQKTLKHVLLIDPLYIGAHFALGNLLNQEGQKHAARRHLKKALTLLADLPPDAVLPYQQGVEASMLIDIINAMLADDQKSRGHENPE